MNRFFTTLFLSWILASTCAAAETATMYFLAFDTETYVSVTKYDIRAHANEKWVISDPQRISLLQQILSNGKTSDFADINVRAVVYLGERTYYINRAGETECGTVRKTIDVSKFLAFHAALRDDEKRSIAE
ncbi:MAG: hypothetical protein ACLPV8_08785 [Steroidobacteraceae bacterium]